MKTKANFKLDYKNLEKGKHSFIYEINKSFFDLFDFSEIKNGNIIVKVDIEYQSIITANINISGTVNVPCDVCLENFDLEINKDVTLFFKFTENELNEEDDVIYVSDSDDFIELSKHFYDYIVLSLPIKKVHPLDKNGERTCNPKIIEQLNNYSQKQTLNNNPEWEKLKKIYNN